MHSDTEHPIKFRANLPELKPAGSRYQLSLKQPSAILPVLSKKSSLPLSISFHEQRKNPHSQ